MRFRSCEALESERSSTDFTYREYVMVLNERLIQRSILFSVNCETTRKDATKTKQLRIHRGELHCAHKVESFIHTSPQYDKLRPSLETCTHTHTFIIERHLREAQVRCSMEATTKIVRMTEPRHLNSN